MRRGLGSTATDIAAVAALPVSVVPYNIAAAAAVTNQGASWAGAHFCDAFPFLCSTAQYQAAEAYLHPELVYAPVSAPPAVGVPSDIISPGSQYEAQGADPGAAASMAVGDVLSQQMADWQAQGQSTIGQTAANLQAIAANQPSLTNLVPTKYLTWILIGTGVFVALVFMTKPGGRR